MQWTTLLGPEHREVRLRKALGCVHVQWCWQTLSLPSRPVLLLSLDGLHFGSFSLDTKSQNCNENLGYLLFMICRYDLHLKSLFSYFRLTAVNVWCVFFQIFLRCVIHM